MDFAAIVGGSDQGPGIRGYSRGDDDHDIDLLDFGHFAGCLTGSNAGPPELGCKAKDSDADHDIDLVH